MASYSNQNDNFSMMQHLIDEMETSNQRIDLFSKKSDSDLKKYGVVTQKRNTSVDRQIDALYDDAWRSEESDGASLQEVPLHLSPDDAGDSGCEEIVNNAIAEVSNDFLSGVRQSAAQNQYADSDESRISSDNEFKRLTGMASYARYPETATGLSDTDWNPYGTESDNNPSPRLQFQDNGSDSKCSVLTSFNPLLNSTDINSVTPKSPDKTSNQNGERMSNILELTERDSTLTHCLIPNNTSDSSQLRSNIKALYTPLVQARIPNQSFGDRKYSSKNGEDILPSKEFALSEEEKKMLASTSSTGYSSAASSMMKNSEIVVPPSETMSIIERAKLMGVPEDILLNKSSRGKSSKTKEFHRKYSNGPYENNESDDQLAGKVRALLSDTTHLSTYDRSGSKGIHGSTVDYTVLQRDLQEIQDNLDSFGVDLEGTPRENRMETCKSQESSEGDGEIIPSTTVTPEKRRDKMIWDIADGIGRLESQQNDGLMRELSLDNRMTSSQRLSDEKPLYNSDGDETRTSESSAKVEDHDAAADLALAEISEIIPASMRHLDSSTDVDHMLSTFQDKRRQLESRYQQLNNQGLAEKVFRILTNQDPESQANGILSEVSADEKQMRTRMALNMHDKNFNYSSSSSWLEDHNESLNPQGDVRKKLDLSGLSSIDSSWIFDRSATKGFTALEDAKRLLSSQMMKASERTFNHSMEMRVPQTIQCYPLFVGNDGSGDKEAEQPQNDDRQKERDVPYQGTVGDSCNHASSQQDDRDNGDLHLDQQQYADETTRPSSTSPHSSDHGSSLRPKDKYRPYRPPGSKEVYYTESDTASVTDSVTTMESTHIGSDDAKGPNLPSHVLGSRKDPLNVAGIYSSQRNLSTVREDTELATIDEKNESNSDSRNNSRREPTGSRSPISFEMKRREKEEPREPQASYLAHKHDSASGATRGEQARETLQRRQFVADVREEQTYPKRPVDYSERRTDNISPTRGTDAARRDARWAHRREELNRGGQVPNSGASIPRERNIRSNGSQEINDAQREFDELKSHNRYPLRSKIYDTPKRAREADKENEPLSLRIQMTYTDDNKLKENNRRPRGQNVGDDRQSDHVSALETAHFTDRNRDTIERSTSPQLRGRFLSSPVSDPLRYQHEGLVRVASDENLNSVNARLSPAFKRAVSPDHQYGLTRACSDENLSSAVRDARLSPAFRRALSPELRNSIERRSPLLSRHLERSLAQPPSDYPSDSIRTGPPTFLARDRPLSPTGYRRHQADDNSGPHYYRPRPRSPSYNLSSDRLERLRQRDIGETTEIGDLKNHRGLETCSQPSTKSKRKVELTLEGMSSESEADIEMDQAPMSKRAQLLKTALVSERDVGMDCDINAMWEKFKAMNDSSSSSINSTKIDAVADLLKSPSRHLVTQYVKDREEYRIERQERAELERESRLREQQSHKQSSSEDEINERYAELLAIKEEERMKRRASKKKKGKPSSNSNHAAEKKVGKDSLFSIPEDRSHEPSPAKINSSSKHQKQKVARQTNVIDPNMLKLRERIAKQKTKVDKDMLKEMRRIEKLKKLEGLLMEKKQGKITNETLQTMLEELSSTSAVVSDFSQESGLDNINTHHTFSDDSTTAKDSSAEMHARKVEKERRQNEFEMRKKEEEKKFLKEKKNHHHRDSLSSNIKKSPDMSEMRLLKLVKDGFLTPEEAYKLAIERTDQNRLGHLDESKDSSIDSDFGLNGKRHKSYSPYSRATSQKSLLRHIPKLKYSGHTSHSSYGVEDFEQEHQPDIGRGRRREPLKYEEKLGQRRMKSDPSTPGEKDKIGRRERSYSPSSTRHHASRRPTSLSPGGRVTSSLGQNYSRNAKRNLQESKNRVSEKSKGQAIKGSVAWQIPMDQPPSQWKEPPPSQHKHQQQPLREVTSSVTNKPRLDKPAHTFQKKYAGDGKEGKERSVKGGDLWTKQCHPRGIPKEQWLEVVKKDALASKTNHWEVDPMLDRVQYILNKPATNSGNQSDMSITSENSDFYEKPVSKMSLQEAFLMRKQTFVSKSSQRQKRLRLAKEDRQLQECLRLEREAIFAEQERLAPPNLYAHPYSDNLYQPKHRILTKQEMKTLTAKRYNKLPEVIGKKEENKKQIEAKLNRLRANLFNKKTQRDILRRQWKQRCC